MFRDQRDFKAVAFRSPRIRKLDDVWALLPKRSVVKGDPVDLDGEDDSKTVELTHLYYYSPHRFASLDEDSWEAIAETRGGRTVYRYDMYLIGFRLKGLYVCSLAVPFHQIAIDVFASLQKAAAGFSLQYQRVA